MLPCVHACACVCMCMCVCDNDDMWQAWECDGHMSAWECDRHVMVICRHGNVAGR